MDSTFCGYKVLSCVSAVNAAAIYEERIFWIWLLKHPNRWPSRLNGETHLVFENVSPDIRPIVHRAICSAAVPNSESRAVPSSMAAPGCQLGTVNIKFDSRGFVPQFDPKFFKGPESIQPSLSCIRHVASSTIISLELENWTPRYGIRASSYATLHSLGCVREFLGATSTLVF